MMNDSQIETCQLITMHYFKSKWFDKTADIRKEQGIDYPACLKLIRDVSLVYCTTWDQLASDPTRCEPDWYQSAHDFVEALFISAKIGGRFESDTPLVHVLAQTAILQNT